MKKNLNFFVAKLAIIDLCCHTHFFTTLVLKFNKKMPFFKLENLITLDWINIFLNF